MAIIKFKHIVRITVALIAFFALGFYVFLEWNSIQSKFQGLSLITVLSVLIVYSCYAITTAALTKLSLQKISTLGVLSGVFINSISTVVGFFVPSGATPTRFILLKKYLNISNADSSSSLFRSVNSGLLANSVIMILITLYLGLNTLLIEENKTTLYVFIVLSSTIIIANVYLLISENFTLDKLKWVNTVLNKIKYVNAKQFLSMLALCFVQTLFMASALFLISKGMNIAADFPVYLLLAAINVLSMIIAITPGNIGIRELIYGLLATKLGVNYIDLIVISLADRALQLLFFCLASGLFFRKTP